MKARNINFLNAQLIVQSPLQQGLKQKNKKTKKITKKTLIVQSPLQQGLKPSIFEPSSAAMLSYRTKSITTRIETKNKRTEI